MSRKETYQFKEMARDVNTQVTTVAARLVDEYSGRKDEDGDPAHWDILQRTFVEMACSFPIAVLKANNVPEEAIIETVIKANMRATAEAIQRVMGVKIDLQAVHAGDMEGIQNAVDTMIKRAQDASKH